MELLSPAGNYESFIGAINAGADAVYLAGSSFGARAYADNFSDDEIIKAIDYAHLMNKKVYLTVNTLIKEREIKKAIEFVRPFYLAGLDGVIIQDIGLISIFKVTFPKLELHSSTQCFITGVNSANYFKKLGCSRVVLARELSLDEIIDVKEKTGLEVETFIHGSMCYSYSGDCLFSSCLGSRSGNRGRCAGPCRLPYLVHDCNDYKLSREGYYLSMKDQCTLGIIPKLIDAKIDSLKIEGRMKKPEYSAFVTSIYRKYIDLYIKNPSSFKVSDKDIKQLKSIYLRSQIQEGYYERTKGKEMISADSPSYNGCDDALMLDIREKYLTSSKKLPVTMYFYISKDSNMVLTINCNDKYVTVEGAVAVKAEKSPVSDDTIKKSLGKLGETFFSIESLTIDNDNDSFVSVSAINDLRRLACEALYNELLSDYRRSESDVLEYPKAVSWDKKKADITHIVSVLSKEQFEAAKNSSLDNSMVCISSDLLDEINVKDYDNNKYIVELPHVLRKRNLVKVKNIIDSYDAKFYLCHNLEEVELLLSLGFEDKIIAGPEIYTWNKAADNTIMSNCSYNIIPYELSNNEIKDVISENSIISVYGRVPLMVTENCVQRTAFSCKHDNKPYFSYMGDRKKIELPVYLSCKYCYNIIYNGIRTSLHEFIISGKLQCDHYMISFTNETYDEALNILNAYNEILEGKAGRMPFNEFTKSYFNKGVE